MDFFNKNYKNRPNNFTRTMKMKLKWHGLLFWRDWLS